MYLINRNKSHIGTVNAYKKLMHKIMRIVMNEMNKRFLKRFCATLLIVLFLTIGVAMVWGTNDKGTYSIKKALIKTPDNPNLHTKLGKALLKIGNYKNPIPLYSNLSYE